MLGLQASAVRFSGVSGASISWVFWVVLLVVWTVEFGAAGGKLSAWGTLSCTRLVCACGSSVVGGVARSAKLGPGWVNS